MTKSPIRSTPSSYRYIMVVLTRNFALLAALASLAAVCLVRPANAAAISKESVSVHAHGGISVSHSDQVRIRPTAASAAENSVSVHAHAGVSVSHHHSLQVRHQPTATDSVSIHASASASARVSVSNAYRARAPTPTLAMKVSVFYALATTKFLLQEQKRRVTRSQKDEFQVAKVSISLSLSLNDVRSIFLAMGSSGPSSSTWRSLHRRWKRLWGNHQDCYCDLCKGQTCTYCFHQRR